MIILGISAFYHDSAACLMRDGFIVAAAQEERFTRKPFDSGFPQNAIEACLKIAGCSIDDVDLVCFYEKPHRKFARVLVNAGRQFPRGYRVFREALERWLTDKLWVDTAIRDAIMTMSPSKGFLMNWDGRVLCCEHHVAHAASAFFPSPFDDAAFLIVDGIGEWTTTSIGHGTMAARRNPEIKFIKQLNYPDSLGLFYACIAEFLGFLTNSAESDVVGLAQYGRPIYVERIWTNLITLNSDGSFRLNQHLFRYTFDTQMFDAKRLAHALDIEPRMPGQPIEQRHMDLAASVQGVIEEVMLALAREAKRVTGAKSLCVAGDVALNSVSNGKLLRSGIFDNFWVQPASGDAGGAVGAALWAWHVIHEKRRQMPAGEDGMQGALLGPQFSEREIDGALLQSGLSGEHVDLDRMPSIVADELARSRIVGVFQGRMEFGTQALGNRSILADPRSPNLFSDLKRKLSVQGSLPSFSAAVMREHARNWFEIDCIQGGDTLGYDSAYALAALPAKQQKCVQVDMQDGPLFGSKFLNVGRPVDPEGQTLFDNSTRVQTVDRARNPIFYDILQAFKEKSGLPLLLNFSLKLPSEPIVCTPSEAIKCFLGTGIDTLVLGTRVIRREELPSL